MTLDVCIGRIGIKDFDPDYPDEIVCSVDIIEQCPDIDYDLCEPLVGSPFDILSKGFTCWPRSAYRSGSTSFWNFFKNHLPEIYCKMRNHPDSNDLDVSRISPIIDQINKLPDECGCDLDNDRMKWFKFWCNRAVELYGINAGVSFS